MMLAQLTTIKALCWTSFITSTIALPTQQSSEVGGFGQAIVTNLTHILEDYNLPQLIVGASDGTDYHQGQIGVHKIGTNISAKPTDLCHLGSNTKAITATTIALLIDEGLIAWHTTLLEIFGQVPGLNISKANANITIELLNTHTSGLSDSSVARSSLLDSYTLSPSAGRLALASEILSATPDHPQGTYEYSNAGYAILGLIIEAVTGVFAEDVIETRIFAPLNITSAGWGPLPETSLLSAVNPYPHIANGTRGELGPAIPFPSNESFAYRDNSPAINTAGTAHMTMEDYLKWLNVHADENLQQLLGLSAATVTKLHTAKPGLEEAYTFGGWIRSEVSADLGGGYLLIHDGSNTVNYFTAVVYSDKRQAVAVYTNVGGQIVEDAVWIEGVHNARDLVLKDQLGLPQ